MGRTRELREIRALLGREELRLLTLTGAAGSGKTRLALEVTGVSDGKATGAVLVELGRVTDAALVARAIANEFGVKERPGHSAREALVEYLRERQALLLLDNFEHVLDAASFVRELLAAAPGVKLLVTSRAPLGVPEERVYPVPALELPDRSQRPSLAELGETEAVRLFVERARAARPDFALTETNAASVSELCVRLDGLPLALELAAARCNLLSPGALLERLGSRLDLLRATPGSGFAERQWTLRGAIEWSYDLLQPEQQQLFTSLAVFVGGFTLAAAEHVAEQPHLDILEGVETLHRNNLLTTEHAAGDEPRLGMLETIREFALERLVARGDGEAVRRRHAAFYVVLAEEAEPGLLGPQQRDWLERLDSERDNIRAALGWALDAGEADIGLRIGAALWRYWQLRSLQQEVRERLQELLALGSGSPATRAKAQTMLAVAGAQSGRPRDGPTDARGEPFGASPEGDVPHGRERARASRLGSTRRGDRFRPCPDPGSPRGGPQGDGPYMESAPSGKSASVSRCVGSSTMPSGRSRRPSTSHGSSETARSVGAWQKSLAGIALMRGDHAQAWRLFEESLAIHRGLDDAWGVSHSLSSLAFLALEAGDAETARDLLSEALAIERDSGHQPVARETHSRCRRGSPPRTGSRRSQLGCTPTRRYSASARAAAPSRSDGPTPREPRRPLCATRRGDIRRGVGARPRDDPPRGHRPGDREQRKPDAEHAVAGELPPGEAPGIRPHRDDAREGVGGWGCTDRVGGRDEIADGCTLLAGVSDASDHRWRWATRKRPLGARARDTTSQALPPSMSARAEWLESPIRAGTRASAGG